MAGIRVNLACGGIAAIAALAVALPGALASDRGMAGPARSRFLTIGGPDRLPPRPRLSVPLRCSIGCDTTAVSTLIVPGGDAPTSKASGHLAAGHPHNLVVVLSPSAAEKLRRRPEACRLRVRVSAEGPSGQRARAARLFRFAPE